MHAPARHPRAAGFTLIEVLVALTIVAVALVSALKATGSLALGSGELRARTLAQWSAENRLAQIRVVEEWPAVGKRTFDCGQAEVALTCQEEVFATPNPQFRRIEVAVHATADGHRLARLVGFATRTR